MMGLCFHILQLGLLLSIYHGHGSAVPVSFAQLVNVMPPVPEDRQVEIKPFLSGLQEYLKFMDVFGTAVQPVKNDVIGNINQIENIYNKNPEKYLTFEALLEDDKSLAVNVLWLKRTLEYMALLMKNIGENKSKSESVAQYIIQAYSDTIMKYHGWFTQQIFKTVAHAMPYRSALLEKMRMNQNTSEDQVVEDMLVVSSRLANNCAAIHDLLVRLDLNSEAVV